MEIDRARAQSLGMQSRDVAQNVLVSLSSSFQTSPAFWLDPKNGVEYSVAVQEPQYRVDSYQALQNTPISGSAPGAGARNTASEESAEGILANWCSWTGVSMTGWKDVVQAAA